MINQISTVSFEVVEEFCLEVYEIEEMASLGIWETITAHIAVLMAMIIGGVQHSDKTRQWVRSKVARVGTN